MARGGSYRLTEDGLLVAPGGLAIAYHGLLHLVGEHAEKMAAFTHGRLEFLEPILGGGTSEYRCLGRGVLWARDSW